MFPTKPPACISVRLYNLACTFHLGLRKEIICLKCKGKTSECVYRFFKNGGKMLMLMQYHCSPLKGRQNKPGKDFRFYGVVLAKSIWSRVGCRVFESKWDEVRLPSPDSSLCARAARVPPARLARCLSGSGRLGSVPLDESVFN